ncbi:MAG: hypothetical protein JSU69_11680 [Candidatus Zixiibacteriota bacterium]|nr:MAG: hypothetical protein JSU69_11680 [candidate division Zixibacteria bacterium]
MKTEGKKGKSKMRAACVTRLASVSGPIPEPRNWKRRGSNAFVWNADGYSTQRFRISLYRFLRDNIPLLSSCIWTWSRLSSAPGKYEVVGEASESVKEEALRHLEAMSLRIYPLRFHKMAGFDSFMPLILNSLYTDGAFAGFLVVDADATGIEGFQPVDVSLIGSVNDPRSGRQLVLETDKGDVKLNGNDFYYHGLNPCVGSGLGQSILSAISFVAYIEQQLIDDMLKAVHNAGYHRLHIQITPPEKLAGESDDAYVDRINEYFDETVSMIRGCRPEDNPVTWDNVKVEYIGPRTVQGATHSWFLNHRAMVVEVCAGTNLAPFMLGYSYGTTHNWAQFKYDLVMRQVTSVQRQIARFLEWIGNIELALKGMDCRCHYTFDNTLSYLASDQAEIEKSKVDNLLKLYSAGLISREDAAHKAGDLI